MQICRDCSNVFFNTGHVSVCFKRAALTCLPCFQLAADLFELYRDLVGGDSILFANGPEARKRRRRIDDILLGNSVDDFVGPLQKAIINYNLGAIMDCACFCIKQYKAKDVCIHYTGNSKGAWTTTILFSIVFQWVLKAQWPWYLLSQLQM